MSAERMTSRFEAGHMKAVIMLAARDLERAGYSYGQIGSAMIGIAAALVTVHSGAEAAFAAIDATRDAIAADGHAN